jgi:hypothetical protein
MRLFLGSLLFTIVFRSLSVLTPWKDWASAIDLPSRPARLPTRAEMAERALEASPQSPHPVRDDVLAALGRTAVFFVPWPEKKTKAHLGPWRNRATFVFCWANSRLAFVENVVGFHQEWPMFSPNVSKRKYVTRARLIYADGSTYIVRNHADPEDLTNYAHWFSEKVLSHELTVQEGKGFANDAFGYCNLLAHQHPTNEEGAALATIRLFQVRYDFPPPGADARAFLAAQNGPPDDQVYPDFYEYHAVTRTGQCLRP